MRLNLGPDVGEFRQMALQRIDGEAQKLAQAVRDPMHATMDAARYAQAQAALQALPEDCTAERFPMLAAMPGPASITEKAATVIAASAATADALMAVEARRLQAKVTIRAAQSIAEIRKVTLETNTNV